ncbi:Armadillo segment polarity protein [Sarcoptes scabiei]|nr:Armadillo segment polarity protein [Sarcoptes scabiei]
MTEKKRIAIIGAGATGMTSTKACLEQNLEPVVFEKTHYTGGLWRFQSDIDVNGIASVMKSTIINSSKEMSAFSDFPPPDDYPNYMHNTKMVAYFDMYSDKFNFKQYVRFRHEIKSLEFADDYDETGRWLLRVQNLNTNEILEEKFDGVMICTGHHGTISMPEFPGQHLFKGRILHTHSLKDSKGFEDQNIVVVGIGNSGGDAAVELSFVAKQVYLSTRTGSWIFNRVGPFGKPFDQLMHRKFYLYLFRLFPYWLSCTILETLLNSNFNHEEYQLRPKHRCLSQHIMVNDALPNRILSGTIKIKSNIEYFTENGVKFVGENSVTSCDTVVMATGYKIDFPFISKQIVSTENNHVHLYKYQFAPNLKHPHTLAFISLAQPIGALLPIGELQARWFALLMAGKLSLPTRSYMEKDIAEKLRFQSRFYQSERHTIQVDWVPFMEELANEIGCSPPLWKYLFEDPLLFLQLIFGPCAPYRYRLVGPNKWDGAREAIMTVQDRIKAPLLTNSVRCGKNSMRIEKNFSISSMMLFGFMIVFFTIYWILFIPFN